MNTRFNPFEIVFENLDSTHTIERSSHFFELIFIVSGTGYQTINHNKLPYQAGHLFLITPEDRHSLEVLTPTRYFQIRFSNIYINNNVLNSESVKKLEYILQHAHHQPGCILKKQTDKMLVRPIVDAIIREHVNRDLYNKELIHLLVNTLIVLIARNISENLPEKTNEQSETKIMEILEYIQSNIYDPAKLTADVISKQFGISETYLGRYFKKHLNETLQDYIINYKLKLVVNRLLYSDMRIGEIAYELGFTDESHLNKTFKKHKGSTPSAFRKNNMVAA